MLTSIKEGLVCGAQDWSEIWGDPLITGSVAMISYLVTGLLVFWTAKQLLGRERILWMICAGLLIFQVMNTPLDLHAFVWTTGRCLAHIQGWYNERRAIQIILAAGVLIVAGLLFLAGLIFFRKSLKSSFVLLTGVGLALGLTVIKGISFHDFARTLNIAVGPFRIADLIELLGVAIAALAVPLRRRQGQRKLSGFRRWLRGGAS